MAPASHNIRKRSRKESPRGSESSPKDLRKREQGKIEKAKAKKNRSSPKVDTGASPQKPASKALVKEKANDFTVSDGQIEEMFPSDSISSATLLQKEMHEMAKHIADADEGADKKKGYSPLIEDGKVFRASATPFVPKS